MGITLAVFQSSSWAAVLNDKLHIFVSSTATSFYSSFILLGRVPPSWWFITIARFFLSCSITPPPFTCLSVSPSKPVKGNPSSAIILRVNGKLDYCPTRRVGWPRTKGPPTANAWEGGKWGSQPSSPDPEPTDHLPNVSQHGPHSWNPGQNAKSCWRGEAGSRWENQAQITIMQTGFPEASQVLFLLKILDSRNIFHPRKLWSSVSVQLWADPW